MGDELGFGHYDRGALHGRYLVLEQRGVTAARSSCREDGRRSSLSDADPTRVLQLGYPHNRFGELLLVDHLLRMGDRVLEPHPMRAPGVNVAGNFFMPLMTPIVS